MEVIFRNDYILLATNTPRTIPKIIVVSKLATALKQKELLKL